MTALLGENQPVLDVSNLTNPHGSEGFLLPVGPYGEYDVTVLKKELLREPEQLPSGATIRNELVTFGVVNGPEADLGKLIVREATIALPSKRLINASKQPWVETDPWLTGSAGLNRDKIKHYVEIGYPVVWLHHGGKQSPITADKSTSRSAQQIHVYLDSLRSWADFDVDEVLLGGYSRGAMTAEKFILLASMFGRTVSYSDTEAPCFSKDMGPVEKLVTLARQVPREAIGICKVGIKLVEQCAASGDYTTLMDYLGTLDPDVRNIVQEILWAKALINANIGQTIDQLPTDIQGVRTFYTQDTMSQQSVYASQYQRLSGIKVLSVKGPHTAGAYPENLQTKYDRMAGILELSHSNGGTLLGADLSLVLGPEPVVIRPNSAPRPGLKKLIRLAAAPKAHK